MPLKGGERFRQELKEFIEKLRPSEEQPYLDDDKRSDNKVPKLSNHKICHEMFRNAFEGRSNMYIQLENVSFDEEMASDRVNEVLVLQGSLLTSQMIEYDSWMFGAMSDEEDEEYRMAAERHYRPYLFSFVAEVNREQYEGLKELRGVPEEIERLSSEEGGLPSPYLWLPCTFVPKEGKSYFNMDGYVVQSASKITKTPAILCIIEDEKTSGKTIKKILDGYQLRSSCLKDDDCFVKKMEAQLGNSDLSTIDVYKIGNGNCVFAQSEDKKVRFFYDIGFHYRHRPQKIISKRTYSYKSTMKEICAQNPSFFILSHWDMDHIAGSAAARKDFFDRDWFAPDCHDACADAKRLAKYLDLKGRLYLAKRPSKEKTLRARLIGQMIVPTPRGRVVYKLYMGEKAACDGSDSNCEGIVMEYVDEKQRVLMMGDVNYASFDKARSANQEAAFADTRIDYLIVPHHGSQHTDFDRIIDSANIIKGTQAVICCTDDAAIHRPHSAHKDKLKDRFDKVCATESAKPKHYSIEIKL